GAVAGESNSQLGSGNPFQTWNSLTDPADADFRLTAATRAGNVLSAPFTLDPNGTTRGTDGVWDRGAYEFVRKEVLRR
ncbi:MAG TPA: hypothetical protein VGK99_13740, partial [Acidobacteriota bacterium]